jgi:hypothetical protein
MRWEKRDGVRYRPGRPSYFQTYPPTQMQARLRSLEDRPESNRIDRQEVRFIDHQDDWFVGSRARLSLSQTDYWEFVVRTIDTWSLSEPAMNGDQMRRLTFVLTATLLVSGSAFGDTLNSGGSVAPLTAFSFPGSSWNNVSSDTVNGTNQINVGNFLTGTGGFASPVAGCPTCGPNYMAGGGRMFVDAGNTPDSIPNLNFVRQAGALSITLLYANSPLNGFAEFGIYDASSAIAATQHHLILQSGLVTNLNNSIGTVYTSGTLFSGTTNLGAYSLSAGSPYATWGLYERVCEEGAVSYAQCNADGNIVTFYMGEPSQLRPNYSPYDLNHEHFALFQAGSQQNSYFAALEDFAFTQAFPTNAVEGYGDFNSLVFGVTTSMNSSLPEPATLSSVLLAVAGFGILSRRKLRK